MLRAFSSPSKNSPTADSLPADSAAPFALEQRSLDLQSDGTFTPDAAVLLTPALLESGLLLTLSPTELQTLLLVLCCVTSNGSFVATSQGLASHLRLWPGQMRARLEQLGKRRWNGQPLLGLQTTESGLRLFMPAATLFEVRRVLVFPTIERLGVPLERPAALQDNGARVVGGLREAIIQHSRAAYARPRAQIEAEINRFLNPEASSGSAWPGPVSQEPGPKATTEETHALTPEENARRELGRRLIAAGLSAEQARSLVESFPLERIERQLEYLPHRHARQPAGMLVASITGDYAPPPGVRLAPAPTDPEPATGEGEREKDAALEVERTQSELASPHNPISQEETTSSSDLADRTSFETPPDA